MASARRTRPDPDAGTHSGSAADLDPSLGIAVTQMSENEGRGHDLSEIARAVVQDDIDLVRELTSKGHTVKWESFPFDETALHMAADNGNTDMIPILLDAGGRAYLDSVGEDRKST